MSFFNYLLAIGPWQVVLVAVVILLLFGGKKIPELMKGLGSGIKEFKKVSRMTILKKMIHPQIPIILELVFYFLLLIILIDLKILSSSKIMSLFKEDGEKTKPSNKRFRPFIVSLII